MGVTEEVGGVAGLRLSIASRDVSLLLPSACSLKSLTHEIA